jgi:DNA-binding NarL/FixJ family response regulator
VIRVVVADDHPVFRYGLMAVLDGTDGIQTVGEAEDGDRLLELVALERPDVVITDLQMPGLDGVAATRELLALAPGTGVLVLTLHDDDASVVAALRAGALGYLVKGADRAEIVRAVQAVAAGEAVYGPSVAQRIVGFYTGVQERYSAQVFPQLTNREREVLDLVAAGCGNHAIAARLHLSEKTVRNTCPHCCSRWARPTAQRSWPLLATPGWERPEPGDRRARPAAFRSGHGRCGVDEAGGRTELALVEQEPPGLALSRVRRGSAASATCFGGTLTGEMGRRFP